MGLSLLSWNVAGHNLLGRVADEPADAVMLQEIPMPPADPPVELHPNPSVGPWRTMGWKTRTVAHRDRQHLHPDRTAPDAHPSARRPPSSHSPRH